MKKKKSRRLDDRKAAEPGLDYRRPRQANPKHTRDAAEREAYL
jgi:hypothetical protein